MSAPRGHRDVDLLYPAGGFDVVDEYLARGDVQEIVAKRFPHKRAFEVDGVMVELFLVQADEAGWFTDFWGVARHDWPADVFEVEAGGLRVASATALAGYRAGWDELQAKLQAGDPASGRTRSWPRIDLVEAELVAFDVLHVEAGLVFLVGDEELAADCAEGE